MRLLALLPFVFLSSCALHTEPVITYANKNHPFSNTAVFSVHDDKDRSGSLAGEIIEVDGKSRPDCNQSNAGCFRWMRTLPGQHKFKVRYISVSGRTLSNATVEFVVDMKPRKIYVARAVVQGDKLLTGVEELPEGYDYRFPLGLKGANYQEFKARFD